MKYVCVYCGSNSGSRPVYAERAAALGQLLASRLGYFIRSGKHAMTREDWEAWLDYADRWLK